MEKHDNSLDTKASAEANEVIRNLEVVRQWAATQGLKLDSNLSYIISTIERYREQIAPSSESTNIAPNRDQIACKVSTTTRAETQHPARPRKKKKPKKKKGPTIDLEKPARKLKGPVQCEQCRKTRYETWKYSKTDGTFKILCRFCRHVLLDQKYGKTDVLDRAVSGGAYGSNRRKF